jgi:site-specific recombinase XerD
MGAAQVSGFLTHLANVRHVSASTQNQALSALLFLYRAVLESDLGELPPVVRARTPERLPVVLSRAEVAAILAELRGPVRLIVSLLYGSGLRLLECLELRVKDIDFDRQQVVVRQFTLRQGQYLAFIYWYRSRGGLPPRPTSRSFSRCRRRRCMPWSWPWSGGA